MRASAITAGDGTMDHRDNRDRGHDFESSADAFAVRLSGFEGPLDENHHRGTISGWRMEGLPWEQS